MEAAAARRGILMGAHPNILIFMVDQMQADVTGEDHPCCMPQVKALAREGVRFTRAFTPSPHCCPSRTTFMTGCYPSRHGIWNNVNTVTAYHTEPAAGTPFFADALKTAGYDMVFSGKWHAALNTRPAQCGWRALTAYPVPAVEPDKDRFNRLPPPGPRPRATLSRPGWGDFALAPEPLDGPEAGIASGPWYRRAIAPALDELPRLATGDRPWCLFVSTDMDPHNPVPRELRDLYDPAAVTPDRYKYVYNAFDFDELYDLETDPDERVNLMHPSRCAATAPTHSPNTGRSWPPRS